jgi:hypothetical protein
MNSSLDGPGQLIHLRIDRLTVVICPVPNYISNRLKNLFSQIIPVSSTLVVDSEVKTANPKVPKLMTLHQTHNMASDADFQFIMGTVLGQKQDSPLFKALEKARITNVGGITSLTD